MEKVTVCVLGCGPAGLFAAHAIAMAGGVPVIASRKVKSEFPGAQYLQRPIPGICQPEPDGHIRTYVLGTKEKYAELVYGDPTVATSWPQYTGAPEPAWDLRAAYDIAWDMYEDQIIDTELAPNDVEEMTSTFPVVLSAIPAWELCKCRAQHKFDQMTIAVNRFIYWHPPQKDPPNFVIYNGSGHGAWYRTAKIFGHESTEAIPAKVADMSDWRVGYKILGNNCDCHPNMTRVGRLGTWKRGVLTHHAFDSALAAYHERLAV